MQTEALLNEAHGMQLRRGTLRWSGIIGLAAAMVALAPPAARAHPAAGGPDVFAATYATQIQYGGPDAGWHDDAPLAILLRNRRAVVAGTTASSTGTTVTWSSANGNGSITFFNDGQAFRGAAQFVGEGPVGYRGTLRSKAVAASAAAIYMAQIQYGGPDASWHDDAPLMILLRNRRTIVARTATPPDGTTISWSSANGDGTITFFNDTDAFRGSAQFVGEGPVGYRGRPG